MHQLNGLKYSIVMPVHNEEKYISNSLFSILHQTTLPQEVIVVNDNCTDNTMELINQFISESSIIKCIHSGSDLTIHQPGSKIIAAFYKGFDQLKTDWDVIVKLDADVILPSNYFEKVLSEFKSDSKIGIAGGLAVIEKNGEWVYENIGNKKQVRGPFKAYSKECFQAIGGLKMSVGWDTADELLANFYGFKVKVLQELMVKLQKPTGKDYKDIHGYNMGKAFYRLDYGSTITSIAAFKASFKQKDFRLFFSIFKGYFNSVLHSEKKMVNPKEGKFIRKYRWNLILEKLKF